MERDWHKLLFTFDGRIGRQEWWIVYGINVAIWLAFGVLVSTFSNLVNTNSPVMVVMSIAIFGLVVWTGLATSIKRYHDRNKSGWWILIVIIPIIGPIWQIIELGCPEGTIGANEYGADPIVRQPMSSVVNMNTENTSNNI